MAQALQRLQGRAQRTRPGFSSVVVIAYGDRARASSPGIETNRAATGECLVTFPESIDRWAWLVSLGAADDSEQTAGCATTELDELGVTDTLVVRTLDAAGAAADRPFHRYVRRLEP